MKQQNIDDRTQEQKLRDLDLIIGGILVWGGFIALFIIDYFKHH